jgi:hypothetical protein
MRRSPSSSSARSSSKKAAPKHAQTAARAKKISITVDERVLGGIEKDAKRSGRTLSAEVTEALACELRRRRLAELISEYEAEHGAISGAELASIEAEWQA